MLILFDNGTPAPLRNALKGHIVVEAMERGWDRLANGELLAEAEAAGFDILLTTDKDMRYQQNLAAEKSPLSFSEISNGRSYVDTLNEWLPPWLRQRRALIPKWISRSNKQSFLCRTLPEPF